MKKSMLAIVFLAAGITFANAQEKEATKLQKAPKTATLKKSDAKVQSTEMMTEEEMKKEEEMMKIEKKEIKADDRKKEEQMKMKNNDDAKATEDTLNTQPVMKG